MSQLPLFDPEAGERRREEAIDRVEDNADPDFKAVAAESVLAVAAVRPLFTTDDVWKELKDREIPEPREPRVMGAVMRQVQASGAIAPTDSWVLSKRPACHRRPLRLWRRT